MSELQLDRAGRRRSPATMPGFHAGRPPRNKGLRYPADPPKVEEIISVMCTAGNDAHGRRLRGLIVVLWRAGLRIQEALALVEGDLDHRRGALLVRRGKGGRRREVGMDTWGWDELQPWLELRVGLPSALCSVSSTAGRVAASGRAPPPEPTCGAPPSQRVSADGSLRISCGTRTPSKWLVRVCRSWSSSASSATAISASPRSTSRGSTTPRSSTPFTLAARR
jgi:integrase